MALAVIPMALAVTTMALAATAMALTISPIALFLVTVGSALSDMAVGHPITGTVRQLFIGHYGDVVLHFG